MIWTKEAVEIAGMDMPMMYRKRPGFFRRVYGALQPRPKQKAQEVTYRGARPLQLTVTLNQIGEYRQDPIAFETLNIMRRHPIVKLGTIIKAAPILTALREVKIDCENKRIAAFIKAAFVDPFLLRVAESSIIPSYIYGVAPHEKVWHTKRIKATYVDDEGNEKVAFNKDALVYKKIKFVHPQSLERWLLQPDTQDFAGFEQKKSPGDKKERVVNAWKSFVFINRFLFGGLWGEAEYSDIYAYWYYSEFFRALQADYLRFKAIPPIIGWAPTGVREDQDGNKVDNLEYAGEVLQRAYDNLVVMLPFEVDESTRQQKFGFRELQVGEHSEVYTRAIEELDVMILRGLIVPERTVTQNMAAVGSYNQAEQHAERMLDAAKMETDRFLLAVNEWLIPQLIEDNFGPRSPECKIIAPTTSEALKAKLHNIVITILQNDKTGEFRGQVAFADLLDFLNIPFTKAKNGMPIPQESPTTAEQQPASDNAEENQMGGE